MKSLGVHDLALDDREVDLGLVEPAGVDWGVDEGQVGPGALEAVDRALAAVGGAVVDDHDHALGVFVGVLGHELVDECVERFDPAPGGAAVEQLGASRVPAGEVAERALALVFVLDLPRLTGSGEQRWVLARSGLDRGLLVGADDVARRDAAVRLPSGPGRGRGSGLPSRRTAGRAGRSTSGAAETT